MEGGAGLTMTAKAQADASKDLDQEGQEQTTEEYPLPQTIFRGSIKRGSPMVVTVPLMFKLSTTPVKPN